MLPSSPDGSLQDCLSPGLKRLRVVRSYTVGPGTRIDVSLIERILYRRYWSGEFVYGPWHSARMTVQPSGSVGGVRGFAALVFTSSFGTKQRLLGCGDCGYAPGSIRGGWHAVCSVTTCIHNLAYNTEIISLQTRYRSFYNRTANVRAIL